jgi:hypothetical protein
VLDLTLNLLDAPLHTLTHHFKVDSTGSMGPFLQGLKVALPDLLSVSRLTGAFSEVHLCDYKDYSDAAICRYASSEKEQANLIAKVGGLMVAASRLNGITSLSLGVVPLAWW